MVDLTKKFENSKLSRNAPNRLPVEKRQIITPLKTKRTKVPSENVEPTKKLAKSRSQSSVSDTVTRPVKSRKRKSVGDEPEKKKIKSEDKNEIYATYRLKVVQDFESALLERITHKFSPTIQQKQSITSTASDIEAELFSNFKSEKKKYLSQYRKSY